jgi:hypothetical protein
MQTPPLPCGVEAVGGSPAGEAPMAGNPTKIVQLRIQLAGLEPPIWRRVRVPADLPLRRLHDVIQAVFDWLDCHLHQFEVGDKIYGQTEIEGMDASGVRMHNDRNVRLEALLDRGVDQFVYRYDFGDNWEHLIQVEGVTDPEPGVEYPVLVSGAHRAPPEDCGGPPGFVDFVEAMQDETHEDHEAVLDWYGQPFDPDDMNLDTVEAMLGRIRTSRRKGPPKGRPARTNKVWMKVR